MSDTLTATNAAAELPAPPSIQVAATVADKATATEIEKLVNNRLRLKITIIKCINELLAGIHDQPRQLPQNVDIRVLPVETLNCRRRVFCHVAANENVDTYICKELAMFYRDHSYNTVSATMGSRSSVTITVPTLAEVAAAAMAAEKVTEVAAETAAAMLADDEKVPPRKWRINPVLHLSEDNIDWVWLSSNSAEGAIELLRANPEKIDWIALTDNSHPWAIEQLQQADPEKYGGVHNLAGNPHPWALQKLSEFPEILGTEWRSISDNNSDAAMALLKANPTRINYATLSRNPHPEAIKLLKASPQKIDWNWLSANPHPEAFAMFEVFPQQLSWPELAHNSHPDAVKMLLANPTKVNYAHLQYNTHPDALALFGANYGNVHALRLIAIWENPAIFEAVDCATMSA